MRALALAGCTALAALALALAGCGGGGAQSGGGSAGGTAGTPVSMEESYRVISVTEHNGSSTVTREGGKQIALYDGLNLQSGDDVVTGAGADLTMLIDSDKYLYAEENTHFWLEASGKEGSSHTTIHLEDGRVLFRLDTKLNAGESYQVSTPNATMSVRGTSGVAEVHDPLHSRISLFEGKLLVTSSEPATGEMRQVTLIPGEFVTVILREKESEGSAQQGESEPQLTVERMTEQDIKLFASSGSTQTSTLEKILEFSADSGKTMNFGSTSITPQEAEKILKNSKQTSTQTGSVNISKAVLKTMSTNGASQQQASAEQEPTEQQPAHEHNYTSKVVARASCTKKGKVEYSCTCGDNYTETIPMKEHNYVTVPGKDSTCTETGLTPGVVCSVCKAEKVAQDVTPMLDHSYELVNVDVEPTCTEAGTSTYRCTVCRQTKQEQVEALGHDLVDDAEQPATCTEPGKAAGQHCTRCDYTTGGEEIAKLGHNYVSNGGSAATCTEPGYSSSTCTRCGDTTSSSTPALGHSYGADGKCIRCGKDEFACEHDFEKMSFEATCSSGASDFYSCKKCGYSYIEVLGEPLPHKLYDLEEVAATCTEDGHSAGQCCSVCGYTNCDIYPALKHTYKEEVKSDQTCTTDGVIAYTCTRCGYYFEETFGALGHEVTTGEIKEATCTKDGLKVGVCDRCKEQVTVVIPALGHDWVEGACSRCPAKQEGNEAGGENSGQTTTPENEAAVLEEDPAEETPAEGEPVS